MHGRVAFHPTRRVPSAALHRDMTYRPRLSQLITAFAFVIGIVTVSAPALSLLHTFEHMELVAAESSEGVPQEAPEADAHCDLCQSLSQSRTTLATTGLLPREHAPARQASDVPLPCLEPAAWPQGPASPRAPPSS